MKYIVDIGAVVVKTENEVEVFAFDGLTVEAQYSEKEFLTMLDSVPKIAEAISGVLSQVTSNLTKE